MIPSSPNIKSSSTRHSGFASFLFVFFTVIFGLALFSFSPEDICSFSSDLAFNHFPHNALGLFGAHAIWVLLLAFGLGIYATFCLLALCSIPRLFFRHLRTEASWDYYAGILIFLFSTSLLFATWPSPFEMFCREQNIATLPGGIIGDFVCGPSGFLLYSFNRIGITCLAGVCLTVSLILIYLYDWSQLIKAARSHAFTNAHPATDNPQNKQDKTDSRESSRSKTDRDAKAGKSTLVQQELGLNDNPAPKPPKESPRPERKPEPSPAPAQPGSEYIFPPTSLLEERSSDDGTAASAREIQTNQDRLQKVLTSFNIDATVVNSVPGPQVTLFKINLANGVKVEKISGLENNIRLELQAVSVRILAPIPGESLVGVEVPNKVLQSVPVRNMLEDRHWKECTYQVPILLGKNISGKTICIDLAKAPHLLIAGATGTGKSVCMNLIIMSLLYRHSPETLRLIMVDPKKVEFSIYRNLPHLLVPVITDNSKVSLALKWACDEMDRRYRILQAVGSRDLLSFNNRTIQDPAQTDEDGEPIPAKLPYIVIVIDELADIMLTSKKEVEDSLARLAALARAVGIHVILATQRPDVKVITGTIKSNFPVRIAFRVASQVDSQTIINTKGAESLLGCGDMLYKPAGVSLERIQGGMASDDERNAVVNFITSHSPAPVFDHSILAGPDNAPADADVLPAADDTSDASGQSLFNRAVEIILSDRKTSISYLQRRLSIGYIKAASLVESLEKNGIIGPKTGNVAAEILITEEEWKARCNGGSVSSDHSAESSPDTPTP